MNNIKIISILLCLLLLCLILFTACGEKENEAAKDESVPDETTVVLETTNDGGTIEKDSEGNKITKDDKGNVVSVEDKDGTPVDVEKYITTHSWIIVSDATVASNSSGKSDDSGSSNLSGKSVDSGSSGGSVQPNASGSGSRSSSDSSSAVHDDVVEESIPVIIATIPDDKDLEKLPDL